jgi:hypothetical protein
VTIRLQLPIGACLGALALACGGPTPLERKALPERSVFIAMERDFQSFRSWGSALLPSAPAVSVTHPAGPRRVYINAFPPEPRADFPVGTLIVKETVPDAKGRVRLLGMVKRGGGYNRAGASGWEWFELEERYDWNVGIVWRGLSAPDGESYGGDPEGTCNSCHRRNASTDYVQSAALRLTPP